MYCRFCDFWCLSTSMGFFGWSSYGIRVCHTSRQPTNNTCLFPGLCSGDAYWNRWWAGSSIIQVWSSWTLCRLQGLWFLSRFLLKVWVCHISQEHFLSEIWLCLKMFTIKLDACSIIMLTLWWSYFHNWYLRILCQQSSFSLMYHKIFLLVLVEMVPFIF